MLYYYGKSNLLSGVYRTDTLIRSFICEGHEVLAAACNATTVLVSEIESLGYRFVPLPIELNCVNPVSDFKVLIS